MFKNVFFIGPASVGKTTTGRLLAEKINYKFIDIDKEFCERIALIPDYIKSSSYIEYCEANSVLTDSLIKENPERTVFATPSGFLVHEDSPYLIEKHVNLLKNYISVLLLPDKDPEKVVDLVVERQVKRWPELELSREKERERFLSRFEKYKNYGDIQIFSIDSPEKIINKILTYL